MYNSVTRYYQIIIVTYYLIGTCGHILQKNRPGFKFSKTIWAILMTLIPSKTLLIQIEVQAVGLPTNLTHSSQLFTVPLTRWKEKVYRKESTGYKVRSKSGCEQASESSTRVLIFTDFFPSVYKQFTQWDVSDSLILFSFYHLHCFHSNSSIDQIIQWVLGGRPVLSYGGTQLYSVSVTGLK